MGKKQKQKKGVVLNLNPKTGRDDEIAPSQSSTSSSEIIEGSSNDTSSDTYDVPDLEDVSSKDKSESSSVPVNLVASNARLSRGEKKARRLIMKLDLKPIENVSRVAMRKNKNTLLYIDNPEVYKCHYNDTVICFGKVLVEDIPAKQAAEHFARVANLAIQSLQGDNSSVPVDNVQIVREDDEGVNKEKVAGMDERDIELVQMHSTCSRKKAIKALQSNNNDVLNAIMALAVR